jgi:hypothetical protein
VSAEGAFGASREHGFGRSFGWEAHWAHYRNVAGSALHKPQTLIWSELWLGTFCCISKWRQQKVHTQQERRPYQPGEVPGLLQLTQEQVDLLIRTGQLPKFRICGEERIDQLISTYNHALEAL